MNKYYIKNILLGLFCMLTTSLTFSQQSPVFKITSFRHSFGVIQEKDGRVKHSFPVENPGGDTLFVVKIKSSAANIEGSFSPYKIAPGGKGEITLTYDPANEKGKIEKFVSVITNDPQNPVRQFGISAEVIPSVKTLADKYPVRIGNLKLKAKHIAMDRILSTKSRTDTFKIYNDWSKTMTFSLKSIPDYVTWKFEPTQLLPGKEGLIILTYDAQKSGAFGSDFEYFFLATNDTLEPEKMITLGTNVIEDFSYLKGNPDKKAKVHFETINHDFGVVKPRGSVEFSYPIENIGKADLVIRRAKPSCGCTVAKLEKSVLKPGEKTVVKVIFTTTGLSGQQAKSVIVICNDPDNPVTMLNFTAKIED